MKCRKFSVQRNLLLWIGGAILLVIIFVLVFGPSLCTHDPLKVDYTLKLRAPCREYPFGTDGMGRSVAARVVYGLRTSMKIAIVVMLISCVIGVCVGVLSGYVGGSVDLILMRVMEVVLAFPDTILALAILGTLGGGMKNQIIALALVRWTKYAKMARDETMRLKKEEYMEAAVAMGNGRFRIVLRYVLPGIIGQILVLATMSIGPIILSGATLSFLGLGVQLPNPELGLLINEGRDFIRSAGHISLFPGLVTALTALGFNLFGEGLNDYFDPRLKEKAVSD
ncbi:MAG: ABC transporter permease [Lachnospiraceae bacterium]|nr:ABC transporter permease [Lachnospiraceae bacterium]